MLLYLAHRIPYPPNKGDKIRSFNQIKYLSQAGHGIHLVSLVDQKQDLQYEPELKKWCKSVRLEYRPQGQAKLLAAPWLLSPRPLSVPCFYSRKLQKYVDNLLQQQEIKTVICFSSVMAEYILRSKDAGLEDKLLVMDFCDLDSDKWLQYSQSSRPPMSWIYLREGSALLNYEQELNRFFDLSLFVSPGEAELFKPLAPCPDRIRVVQNGVDHEFFNPRHHAQHPSILFTGAMDYQANVEGMLWFCNFVWPVLQDREPGLQLYIVGSNPRPEIRQLAGQYITVTGYVQDVRHYYQLADICVIPLRLARGVQNKALEAMAMATPVVTTPKVLQGIQATAEQDVLVANNEQEFVDQIRRLLHNEQLALALGQRGREFVLKNFNWQRNLQRLDSLLKSGRLQARAARPKPSLSPAYLAVFILFMLITSLWPMQETSPGSSLTMRLNPGLQNFLHLPLFTVFAWLFLNFLQQFRLAAGSRYAFFFALGASLCIFLEVLQIVVPGRWFSLSDIMVNLLGLGLGLGLYQLQKARQA